MTTPEPGRLALYNRLIEVLGREHADDLIKSLPMEQARELATKSDISELKSDITELRAEMLEIHKILHRQNRLIIGAMAALTGIFSLIVGLIT